MTLISKLAAFVEVRYEQIAEKTESYQTDYLRVQDVFKWRNYDIEANIDLKVKEQVEDEESQKNLELVEDIREPSVVMYGVLCSRLSIKP